MIHTDADFERLSWHDCHMWGVELRPGDPDEGDWTSDLALDIDFIVEWICGEITFGAVGFTQTLRAEAVLTEKQCLSPRERRRLPSPW